MTRPRTPRSRPWFLEPPHPLRDHLARILGILPATAQVLLARGYTDPEAADRYLRAPLDALRRPAQLPDLAQAARVLWDAARSGLRITVYGDFDADGVCATAVLVRGLRALGVTAEFTVPHRMREGYGLTVEAVQALAESGTGCLVAVDCGVGALEEVALARELGMRVVVVDHHEPPPALPCADALVDPKIPHRPYPFRGYSASGLSWLLVAALRELAGVGPSEDLLELAAVGTVADVVPLVDDNRVLVRHGLRRLEASPLPGLQALLRACGLSGPVGAEDVAWRLAPRLNAAGRVDSALVALRLLLTDDPGEAQELAGRLERHNAERQRLQEVALGQAVAAVEELGLEDRPGIVVWGEGWHPGVVGLVAGRLREAYWRPAVALAVEGRRARGSARGVPGLDLVEVLAHCGDLLERFGGHAQAAGLSLPSDRLEAFRRRFEEAVAARLAPELLVPVVRVEAEVGLDGATERLVEELTQLEPFGPGNPRPVLAARGLQLLEVGCWGTGEHLWLRVCDGTRVAEAVGFGLGEWGELLAFTQPEVELAGYPERSRWQEGEVRWLLEDLRSPGLELDQVLADTAALLRRLAERAEDYLGEAHRSVELRPAFFTKVVGVTFEGRQGVVARLEVGEEVFLRRQPDNPVDPHAVQVVRADGAVVGYLNSALAGRLAPHLDRGARYRVTVTAVTGGGDKNVGANLRLEQEHPQPTSAWVRSALVASGPDLQHLDRLLGGEGLGEEWQAAAERVLRGGRLAVVGPPRPPWSRLPLVVAAAYALRGRRVVHVAPLVELAEARWQSCRAAMERVGLRGVRLHGLVPSRELAEAEEAVQAGCADVVFTTPAYLGRRPEVVTDDVLVVAEGWVEAQLPPELLDHQGPFLWGVWDPKARPEGWEVCGPRAPRTEVRMVDRRRAGRRADDWLRDVPAVLFAPGPRSAVEAARSLGERGQVAYDHPGLPGVVRETLVQLFNQGKLSALVCGGPAPAGLRGARTLVWLGPTAKENFLQQAGHALHGQGQAALVLAFGPPDLADARREWESRHPSRRTLATLYRLLQGWQGELRWPDPALAEAVRSRTGLDPALAVPAAVHVFEGAGLLQRERTAGGWKLHLCAAEGRKDLGSVLRFAEGERSRAAFEAGSRWMLGASAVEVLEQVASPAVAAPLESGAG